MGSYKQYITNAGENLMTQALSDGALEFTRVAVSSTEITGTEEEIRALTDLSDVKQTTIPAAATASSNGIRVQSSFTNEDVTESYLVQAVGLYARIGDDLEVLFDIAVAEEPSKMTVPTTSSTDTLAFNFNIAVQQADKVTITVAPGGSLPSEVFYEMFPGMTAPNKEKSGNIMMVSNEGKWEYVELDNELSATSLYPVKNKAVKAAIDSLNQAIAEAKDLRASLLQHGMVKLTESSAVTDSTGLALAATEKNAMIPGTLANQLSSLNTDYASFVRKMSQGIRFYMDSKNMPNGFTIRDDGLVIVNDVEIYQGDIVHLAGTNNGTPYGSFSGLFCQGNYGAVRTDYFSSNSINTSDVHIGANGAWGGQLCFRITPSGTLPTNGFCDFKITVISCKRFYL